MIILDFGSGNTCKNDKKYIKKMIDELAKVDKERKCIIKWQLFDSCSKNEPLSLLCFEYAYKYAKKLGFKTTASVFDVGRLRFLLTYDIPFVKIPNRRDLYYLIDHIPRSMEAVVSSDCYAYLEKYEGLTKMFCISEYPASKSQYTDNPPTYCWSISDHTIGVDLYNTSLNYWEKHYKLKDSTGLDAGEFASTPEELKEIL